MFDIDKWQEIFITITKNRTRSILTAFGVFWGVFMLVIMSGIGYGFKNGMLTTLGDFKQNSCFIFSNRTSIPYKGYGPGRFWSLKTGDIEAIKTNIPEVEVISGIIFAWKEDNNVTRDNKYGSYYIKGYSADYGKIDPQKMLLGRYINEVDILHRRRVCVIGENVHEEMFGKLTNPLGETIHIKGAPYVVIGVNKATSKMNMGGESEKSIILPFSTLQQTLKRGESMDGIALAVNENSSVSKVEPKITALLRQRNNISPKDISAVNCFNLSEQFNMFNNLFLGITILIWIVGGSTLLAGVIGVTNIMLVSVKERTKEIGIKRALGAKPINIVTQIISESTVLTSLAGVLGLGFSVAVLEVVAMVMRNAPPNPSNSMTFFGEPQIPFTLAVIATVVIILAGVMAGLLPASRAINIKAIDAIREE